MEPITRRKRAVFVRRGRKTVLLALPHADERTVHAILDAALDWPWRFLDLELTRGFIPPGLPVGGAIVNAEAAQPLAGRLRDQAYPVVGLDRRPAAWHGAAATVQSDYAAAGRLAADHFAERGFSRVAYEVSDPRLDVPALRDAFEARARECGMTCSGFRLRSAPPGPGWSATVARRHEQRARRITRWLAGLSKPVAVLSTSSATLCDLCTRAGIAVPEEIALLGVGNHRLPCELSPVPLSSIDMAFEEQGRQAALLLRRLMRGEAPPKDPVVIEPAGIVARRSTDTLAIEDESVVRALRFLWDHYAENLSVEDVAEGVGVPRHHLERAFRRHLRRGVNAELQRKRIEEFRRRLRATDLPIADLAPMTGFRSLTYLHRSFRAATGMTPLQYRQRARRSDPAS